MKNKIRSLSVKAKISCIYIITNAFILLVNMVLLIGINRMSTNLEQVYTENLRLNELSDHLSTVQDNMTEYLTSKTSDSLGEYYVSAQKLSNDINDINGRITNVSSDRMLRNIKELSENYLELVDQTIEAKRGRNVEKYRVRYDRSTKLYKFTDQYIYSLNNEQFKTNSARYVELITEYKRFEKISIIVIVTVILLNILLIIKLSGNIIRPLSKLAEQANVIANGNFDIELMQPSSMDEIGIVTKAFNQMVESIREYIEKIRVGMETERELKEKELLMETHLKDAQLKYLQAQINPHFMFNTLNAGAQLSMLEGDDKTYDYLQNVAEFFRYTVKKGNDNVTIKDEIELVNHYIYILNVRFSGEIKYTETIDEDLLNVMMPGMILQPIVENSVNHGIREMAGRGRIDLSIYRMDDLACISIKDNGVGMTRETIKSILDGTYEDIDIKSDSNGIGMDNVIARLKLFTGSEDVMSIISEGKNMGTEVIVYLPVKEEV